MRGAVLADGRVLAADATVLAAGAWTPGLVDLRGLVRCTAQPLAYVALGRGEAAALADCPVQLNLSTGLFFIPPPPPPRESRGGPPRAKLARHSHGFANPAVLPHPEPHLGGGGEFAVSVPCATPLDTFPASAAGPLAAFARRVLPAAVAERDFAETRLCHYADTPTGDFLVDWHPR